MSLSSMSSTGGQTPSDRDLDLVKNGIERCIQLYMNKREAINALFDQYKIQPCVTELVWERLEKENPEFFKAYYAKVLVKDQIMQFNRLLSEQVERMRQSTLTRSSRGLTCNASHILSTQQIPTPISAQSTRLPTPISAPSTRLPTPISAQTTRLPRAEDMRQPNVFHDNGPSTPPWQIFDWDIHTWQNEVSPDMFLAQNQNVGLAQRMNGRTVNPEYAGRSLFNFSPPTNLPESHPPLIADASVPHFSSVEPNQQDLPSFLLDLEQFQQTSPPVLPPAGSFAGSYDLPGGYSRPPFRTTDANNFMDPHFWRH